MFSMQRKTLFYLAIVLSAFIYCEFCADFVKLAFCSWPRSGQDGPRAIVATDSSSIRALVLSDTHILGPFNGHWLDKLYREWHMSRAFQASITLFQPDVVFVLGDLFDEGSRIDNEHFEEHVRRFRSHFRVPLDTPVISAVGNHDVGFHYGLHPYFIDRFKENFNNTGVHLYSLKDIHFVLVNSMAMENDGCHFCEMAMDELKQVSKQLNCMKNKEHCNGVDKAFALRRYSRPILLQHFPTYRISDQSCKEHDNPDTTRYRENWEVLSKASTERLGQLLHPRVAFAGHSHHYCRSTNQLGIEEYTVASFSWRNKVNPSFLLATFTTSNYAVSKCDMLLQQTVYNVYMAAAILCLVTLLLRLLGKQLRWTPNRIPNVTKLKL